MQQSFGEKDGWIAKKEKKERVNQKAKKLPNREKKKTKTGVKDDNP